jgi:hypothetical protein
MISFHLFKFFTPFSNVLSFFRLEVYTTLIKFIISFILLEAIINIIILFLLVYINCTRGPNMMFPYMYIMCIDPILTLHYTFLFPKTAFLQYWGLNSGPHTCWAGTLLLKPLHHPKTAFLQF